jgi:lysophospholipase L1-like esterase
MMAELLEREPDLFVIYSGHNEFLEDRTYGELKVLPRWLSWFHLILLDLRLYSLAHDFVAGHRRGRAGAGERAGTVLPAEVQTRLDLEDGLNGYHRDDEWRRNTVEHFRFNLEKMVRMARRAGVPVILMNPASNLADCPPFKSEHGAGLPENVARRVDEIWQRARDLEPDDMQGKVLLLEQAVALDGRHAGLLYHLGRCFESLGRLDEAKRYFERAKEEDVCPLRIIEPMHESIRMVARDYSVPLIDVKALFEERCEGGIVGDEMLLDHVHPSIGGHQLIAMELFRVMAGMNMTADPPGWKAARDELWRQQISSLDSAYYARGEARLQRLLEWSRGRIPK